MVGALSNHTTDNQTGADTLRKLGRSIGPCARRSPMCTPASAPWRRGVRGRCARPENQELIAFAIGVVEGCDGCIASHGQAAVKAGATEQEAAEAIGVTFLMHGGPATIHGARA